MIDLVKRFFGQGSEDGSIDKKGATPHDIRIATCALFLEMSYIDGEFDESEREHVISILKKNALSNS